MGLTQIHWDPPTVPSLTTRGLRAALAFTAVVVGLWAASPSPTAASLDRILVVGANFGITSLDPARTIEATSYMIEHAVYDSLVTFDGEDFTTLKPSLAIDWEVSSDGKTYRFKLRTNVRFASGNPCTSADVKWSLDRVKHVKGTSAFLLDSVEEVQAPDPYTVVLRLKTPNPALLPILSNPSLGVLDSKLVSQKGGDASADAKDRDKAEPFLLAQSAGTGAYVMERYVPYQEIVLVQNPNHWRGAPKVQRIVIRNITEPAAQKLQLERGDLDIGVGLDQDQIRALKNAPGVVARTSLSGVPAYLAMNNTPTIGGPFSNGKVQQAIRHALDYDGILAIAGPGAVRLAGIIPTIFRGSLDPREAIKTDREKAKQLLREANLGQVTGAINFATDRPLWGVSRSLIAQKVQSDLAAVGITVRLNGLPHNIATQLSRDGKTQFGLSAWPPDYPDSQDYLVFAPGRTIGRRTGWLADSSPEARELSDLAQEVETEVDPSKRVALYQRFGRRVAQSGPYVPLFEPAFPYAFRSTIRGVTYNSVWGLDFWTVSK
jgi:peptide/nickel transport system substrate-binding protein